MVKKNKNKTPTASCHFHKISLTIKWVLAMTAFMPKSIQFPHGQRDTFNYTWWLWFLSKTLAAVVPPVLEHTDSCLASTVE